MPLRDHFRPPVDDKHAWNELHAMWPAMIVQQLYNLLPEGFVAAPSVYLGAEFEIDIGVLEEHEPTTRGSFDNSEGEGGVATAKALEPPLTLEAEFPEQDEFEVRIYDTRHGRTLVAAIELVSPGNKDRPENRRAFLGKVSGLLQKDVCVTLVDLVTPRHFNLYAELLEMVGRTDPRLGNPPSHLYAVTLRGRKQRRKRTVLDLWYHQMTVGEPLPTLPIWLEMDRCVNLPFESSYEETCKLLRIR